jgi:hypothetical protein
MKLRNLVFTVAALAALSAIVFVARRPAPPPSADARLGQPLADKSAIEKAAKLRLSDQGKTVTLVRQPDATWRVASYFDLPADFSKLSNFVGTLTDAKLDRLVSTNAERIARLEFKDTKVELLDAADKELWSVTLGKNADTGGRYVRFGTEQKAYLANLNAWLDPEQKNWASTELLNLKPDDIARIEITFPPAAAGASEPMIVTVSRTKKGEAWTADKTPAGQKVQADKIASLLGSLGSVRFSDTNDLTDANATAAKANQRVFKLTTFDGKTVTVALGRKPEEKKLRPPTATTDGKTGPAALGTVADFTKKDAVPVAGAVTPAAPSPAEPAKPLAPEFETIPAGPVFAFVASSDSAAPVNALMQKRAFQVSEVTFTGLPQKADEIFESAPPPAAPAKSEPAKTPEEKKPAAAKP